MSALVNGISTSTRERHDSMVPFYGRPLVCAFMVVPIAGTSTDSTLAGDPLPDTSISSL